MEILMELEQEMNDLIANTEDPKKQESIRKEFEAKIQEQLDIEEKKIEEQILQEEKDLEAEQEKALSEIIEKDKADEIKHKAVFQAIHDRKEDHINSIL